MEKNKNLNLANPRTRISFGIALLPHAENRNDEVD